MNFWKTVLAVLTLGAVGGARADDVTSRQLGVSNPIDTDNNNNIGGGVPIPEPNRFLSQAPQVQIVEESKDLAETYDQLFRYLDVGQKNRGAVDNAKWNAALEKLTPDQQAFFVQVKELQKPQKQRRLRDGRVLDIAGVVCQPVNLFLGLDGSNTQGQLSIVKQAGSQSMGEVTPVNTGVIVFGNVARVVVPFGPAGSVTANQAVISSIPPGVAGPGTNIAALFDAFLAQLQANPIINNYPIIFEVMSDYKNTVGTDAGVLASYQRLANYVKATYPNNEFKIVGFAVPGASGTDLELAQQTSRDFDGKPDAALYPTAPQLLDGVTAENNEFCGVPPVATVAPVTTGTPSMAPTTSPTAPPPGEVPPAIPGVLTAAAVGAFAWWGRGLMVKKFKFEPNPAFEAKVEEAIRTSGSTQPGEDDASFALRMAEYNKRLKEYNDWLLTPNARNDVNAVPSKQPGANNKPGVNLVMQKQYGIPLTSGVVANRGVDDDQGIHQAMTRPIEPKRREQPDTGEIRRRLANDPSMPPPVILKKLLEPEAKSGLLSPFYAAWETRKGFGPKVQEINSPETQPEVNTQNKTSWQKVKAGFKGLLFGELTNDNVGKPFTRIKEKSPAIIRVPVSALSVVVRYTFQFTYASISLPPWAIIRFFNPNIEFPLFTPKGRKSDITRQDLEQAKAMNLTVEQRAYIDRIDPNTLPVAKAGYQMLWEGVRSVFKRGDATASATSSVARPVSVVPPSQPEPSVPNPLFARELHAASQTRRETAESVEEQPTRSRAFIAPPASSVAVPPPAAPLASPAPVSFGGRTTPMSSSSSAPPMPAGRKPPPRPGTGTLPLGERPKPPPRPSGGTPTPLKSKLPPGGGPSKDPDGRKPSI